MNREQVSKIAGRVARSVMADGERDEALENVDQAVDAIIAGFITLDENLSKVMTNSVKEKAAIDTVVDTMNEGVKPYFADVVKALQVFD
jgi:hypothetical protein